MNCKNCGTPISNGESKCPSCGTLIETAVFGSENNNVTVTPIDNTPETIENGEIVTTEENIKPEQPSVTPEVNDTKKQNSLFKVLIALILLGVIIYGIYYMFFR